MKGADRKRWGLTVAKRQGSGREAVAERSRRQNPDHRNTKRQRGRVCAASVLLNAKPKAHQGTPGKAAWPGVKVSVLTQGGLGRESGPGVSRGRSSEDAVRKHGGAKGRRCQCKATQESVSQAQPVHTSAARGGDPRRAERTRNAGVVQPHKAALGETLWSTRDT